MSRGIFFIFAPTPSPTICVRRWSGIANHGRIRRRMRDFFRSRKSVAGLKGMSWRLRRPAVARPKAACLWALRQAERGRARKLFFLLPTMVTANSVQKRLVEFFDREQGHRVGLVHSTAELINNGMEGDDADRADVRAGYLGESHFFPPVVVGTVDQLLVTLFHAGRWAMKTLASADAAIVIDEVHAYDPYTTGLLVLLIEQLRDLGARFLVMSATMPTDLQTTIRKALEGDDGSSSSSPSVTLVEDKKYTDSARNVWGACETPLTEWLTTTSRDGNPIPSNQFRELWGETSERGKSIKILIVVNTVKRCQDLAKALRMFDPVCYHSKFVFLDRYKKEKHILDDKPRSAHRHPGRGSISRARL